MHSTIFRALPSPSPVAALLLAVACLASNQAVAQEYTTEVSLDGDAGPVLVRWLANAGVLIESGDTIAVIDGFFDGTQRGNFHYTNLPEEERQLVRTGKGKWRDVDIVLTTHHHFDHFNAQIVGEHLAANPNAVFAGTGQAADRLRIDFPGWADVADRAHGFSPRETGTQTLEHQGMIVTFYDVPHAGSNRDVTENVAIMVEIDGVKVIHFGDASTEPRDYEGLGLPDENIDLALVPAWFVSYSSGMRIVHSLIGAKSNIAMHLYPERDTEMEKAVRTDWPNLRLFSDF